MDGEDGTATLQILLMQTVLSLLVSKQSCILLYVSESSHFSLGQSVELNQVYTQQGQVSGQPYSIQDVFQSMRSLEKQQQKNSPKGVQS